MNRLRYLTSRMVRVFESIYWNKDKFQSYITKIIKKNFKGKGESIYHKIILLPYRLIRYRVNDIYREALVDVSTYTKIDDPLNLIFTVRNDYLYLDRLDMELDEDLLLRYDNVSNISILNRFIALLNRLRDRIEEYRASKFIYARDLARYNLNRIILGPLQNKKKLADSEEKASEAMKLEFIKEIIEDGLGLHTSVDMVDDELVNIYMPTLFIVDGDRVYIYEIGKKKIKINVNLASVYSREERYRSWLYKLLI